MSTVNLKITKEKQAQASLEYALVLVGFLSIILTLGALWRLGDRGVLDERINEASSHTLKSKKPVAQIADILLY